MKLRKRTLDEIADMICGNGEGTPFVYRSSSYITRFFQDADTDFVHDGSTRYAWVNQFSNKSWPSHIRTRKRRRRLSVAWSLR